MEPDTLRYLAAMDDFRRARQLAALEYLTARLTGRETDLLPFEEVRQMLKARESEALGLQEIPLDAIVGSVGRYGDFTRSFLPRRASGGERWARVKVAVDAYGSFSPIEVYQIGDAYFVLDGNHRVSIARKAGVDRIHAYVTRIQSRVPLSANASVDEVIVMAEYADFLERTRLDETRPTARLIVTAAGRYPILLQQIEAYRQQMTERGESPADLPDAAGAWYDRVYFPAVEAMRAHEILRDFPGRTETDLYVWLSQHRELLQRELGWEIAPESAVIDLVEHYSRRPERIVARLGERLRDALTPDEFVPGPAPGSWRRERVAARQGSHLFKDILVVISGEPHGWPALEQALSVARREEGRLLGLHIEPARGRGDTMQSQVARSEFYRRCEAAGIHGEFVVATGSLAETISERAWWADLVITPLRYTPPARGMARSKSRFRTLVRRCPRPLLATPGDASPLSCALLAYDGSVKADEALYVATYVAGRWSIPLTVVTVPTENTASSALEKAREYLERRGIEAEYELKQPPIAASLLASAAAHGCNWIIMGSFGYGAVREAVLGSTVNDLLKASQHPILICR